MSPFHWIIIGQALLVLAFVMIYASGFAGGGVAAGVRLGIMLEIAAIGMRLLLYAVAFSRKVDRIRQRQRSHRDDYRRRNCWCDLQTGFADNNIANTFGRTLRPRGRRIIDFECWALSPFGLRSGQAVERLPSNGYNGENTRCAWVSHASGMGTACGYLALLAPAGRNQFP